MDLFSAFARRFYYVGDSEAIVLQLVVVKPCCVVDDFVFF